MINLKSKTTVLVLDVILSIRMGEIWYGSVQGSVVNQFTLYDY